MTQRRGNGELVEVGLSRKYRPPVGHVADGGKGIATDLLELERIGEGDGVDPDADEPEEQRRQGGAAPPAVVRGLPLIRDHGSPPPGDCIASAIVRAVYEETVLPLPPACQRRGGGRGGRRRR